MNTFISYLGTISILMGDGTHARILSVGKFTLATKDRVLHLSNILHVPTILKKILLVS